MRRFRLRRRLGAARRRALGLALPLAATFTAIAAVGASPAQAAHQHTKPKATLKTGRQNVRFGHHLRLSGHIPGASKKRVVIYFRPRHGVRGHAKAFLRTGERGAYWTTIRARKSGTYSARARGAKRSRGVDVRVLSRLHTKADHTAIAGGSSTIRGRVLPGTAGRKVKVDVGGQTLTTHTDSHGRFVQRWHASSTGRYRVHVKAEGDRVAAGSSDGAGSIVVFRHAVASYYGPGFYGGRTACGGTLEPGTLGVANKTLPCGTKVTLRYGGRQVTVPVIDRGPYVAGRDYDLTEATKSRLGFPSTGTLLSSK
jgi:rare lipoprotein A